MATRYILLGGLGSAFLIGFLYMIVLRFIGGPIIYCSILGLILANAYGGYMLYEMSLALPEVDPYK